MDDIISIPQKGMAMLFGDNDCNEVKMVLIELIDDFPNHPYPVHYDDALVELENSIAKNGQLEPAIVRALGNGRYQMLSGHRRKLAHHMIMTGEDITAATLLKNLQWRYITIFPQVFPGARVQLIRKYEQSNYL